jgi:predicted dehydrogenase/threonine dehydrogenase-like Zn-dependent dehydrogenase
MKHILQHLKDGKTEAAEVPCPGHRAGRVLIRTRTSLVSAGTERMLIEFGKAGWIEKARQQPDKVKQVLDKVRTDGLAPTLEAVRSKLDQPIALGYCNVGEVIGEKDRAHSSPFRDDERVVSNGPHAEIVSVPHNLCARVPDGVADDEAAFAVVGAIALQGIRLAVPTLGEAFVVTGLGLIGLMAVQLLKAHGCRVLGLDYDGARLELARHFGAETVDLSRGEDPVAVSEAFSRGRGVDGVLITAAARSSEPVHQAALMCRKRGRIVLVGVTGLELSRDDFYRKELSFQVSCSYGPGRYDPEYEEKGHDYPVGYVRWTEQRNFEAVLDMMASGALDAKPLISHRFPIERAEEAYEVLGGREPTLGILLEYGTQGRADPSKRTLRLAPASTSSGRTAPVEAPSGLAVGFIGAGSYAGRVLIPAFRKAGASLKTVASGGGVSACHIGKKFGFEAATTDADEVLNDERIGTVVIATRHDSHARLVREALMAGKHVFVEKPLCLTLEELAEIEVAYSPLLKRRSNPPLLMVGFNRRFAPQVLKMKALLDSVREPMSMIMTVNAGSIPADHWTQDPAVGGGRIIGEACHFIDLLRFLAGAPIADHDAVYLGSDGPWDRATLTLRFADGSVGTVHYLSSGHKSFPKERLEVFRAGRVLQLDNFRKLRGYGWPGFRKMNLWRQDKGQTACAAEFLRAVEAGGPSPIPLEEILEVSRAAIELALQ